MRIKRVYFSSSLVFVQVRSFFPLRLVYIVGDGYSYLLRAEHTVADDPRTEKTSQFGNNPLKTVYE